MARKQVPSVNGEEISPKRTPRPRKPRAAHPVTSKQRLSTIIKRVRDKLREDAGISTDAERLPQLTWMLFLKFLDDHEKAQEEEHGERHEPIIEAPYRWRDWANPADIQTARKGDELIAFVNNDLFEYLRKRSGSSENDLRDVVGKIFRGTFNLVRSGYILREVLEKLDGINFNSSDDVHLVSHFYETMLREMRDASGKSGEFYTPRPLIRLIIDRLAPKLGERVLDPACGTCGFLAEAYDRLKPEAKNPVARRQLQANLLGIEKKTMPYLLGVVNLLLHGIDQPALDERNTLTTPISSIKDADRVEIIATNPPFGGEEEEGVLNNFPQGMRTKETAILFFQYIMARLKRQGGRCGIILPNGFLSGQKQVEIEVKRLLLQRFNLHTLVRLPDGVFEPYARIPTNVLFFDAPLLQPEGWCTQEIWYYEHPLPEGRRGYTKKKPLEFAEFEPLVQWWTKRQENDRAWKVPVQQVIDDDFNLDLKNPHQSNWLEHLPPEALVKTIIGTEHRVLANLMQIEELIETPRLEATIIKVCPTVTLGNVLKHRKEFVNIDDSQRYKRCRVQWYGKGVVSRDAIDGASLKTKKQQVCRAGELLVAEIDAKEGGFGVVPLELDGAIVSSHYFLFTIDSSQLDIDYLTFILRTKSFQAQVAAQGSTNYAAIRPVNVMSYKIPLPPLDEQQRIVAIQTRIEQLKVLHTQIVNEVNAMSVSLMERLYGKGSEG